MSMRVIVLIILIILLPFHSSSQSDEIYATRIGMKNDKPLIDDVKFHIKGEGEGYLIINWIEDVETGKKVTDLYKIWGVKYNKDYYYHLSNARGINALKNFIKIDSSDLTKNYLSFSINCEAPIPKPTTAKDASIAAGSLAIGMLIGSEAGFILMITTKDKKSVEYWTKNGNSGAYIYIIDMNSSLAPIAKRFNKKRLKKLLFRNGNQQEYNFNNMKFEEAISLINTLE